MTTPDPIARHELPEPVGSCWFHRGYANFDDSDKLAHMDDGRGTHIGLYTADQMRAYGQACVDAAHPIPADMVLVPRRATPEMLADFWYTATGSAGGGFWLTKRQLARARKAYAAMLAAAPPLNELLGQPEEFNLNEVSGNSGQLASLEQRARATELLRLHAEPIPVAVEDGAWFMVREQDALDAITAALSAQPRVTPEHWIEIGKAQALAEFTEQRAAQRRELLAAPQPREGRGVDAVHALVAEWRQRPGITDAYKICATELETALATTPQEVAGVEEIDPGSSNFRAGYDVAAGERDRLAALIKDPVCSRCGAKDATEAAEKCRPEDCGCPATEFPLSVLWKDPDETTPPPGVDVGKLRELRELVVDLRKDASGGEGYNYTAYEEGRIAEKRYCAHRLAEIIGEAATGVQP